MNDKVGPYTVSRADQLKLDTTKRLSHFLDELGYLQQFCKDNSLRFSVEITRHPHKVLNISVDGQGIGIPVD